MIRASHFSEATVFHALRRVPSTDLQGILHLLGGAFLCLAGMVAFLFPRITRALAGSFISIRWKVPLLFLYSLLIPLAGLAILGNQTIHDRWEVMAAEVHQAALDHLSQLDEGFERERVRTLARCRQFREMARSAPDRATLASKARSLEKASRFNWAEVRDIKARLLFTNENPDLTRRIGIIANTLAKDSIEHFLGGRRAGVEPLPLNAAEVFVQRFFLSPATGWPKVLQRPDVLHPLLFGNSDMFYSWDVMASATSPAAMVQADIHLTHLREEYLKRQFAQRVGVAHGAFRLAAWNEPAAMALPAGSTPGADLTALFRRVRVAREPVRAMMREGDTDLTFAVTKTEIREKGSQSIFPRTLL